MSDKKPIDVVFLPGSFDGFDGTQEELDELIAEIKAKVADGSLFEESIDVDIDDLPPAFQEKLERAMDEFDAWKAGEDIKKKLN